jgi:peptidoglycan/LPS O-acetylase OafA/YrhL
MSVRNISFSSRGLDGKLRALLEPVPVDFKINNFDLLRILAAFQVVLVHSMGYFGLYDPHVAYWLSFFPGVPIFFVISGYLVSASFERQKTVHAYLKNRFLRIFPGLWACLLFTTGIVLLLGFRPSRPVDYLWLPAQFVGLIFTPPFLKSFGIGSYNGSLWTIPVELQFYLALPIVYKLVTWRNSRKAGMILAVAIFAAIRVSLYLTHPSLGEASETTLEKLIRYSFLPHFVLFLLGVTLQNFRVHQSRLISGKVLIWLPIYLAAQLLLPENPWILVFRSLLLGFLVVSAAYTAPTAAETILRGEDISYGVYIYHALVISLLLIFRAHHSIADIGMVFAGAVILGGLSWRFVEMPFLRKKRKSLGIPVNHELIHHPQLETEPAIEMEGNRPVS